MEDYLMGNRIIRDYSKIFNDKELNRMLRCTLILGIQTLKEEIPNYNSYSPQELENIIIESLQGDYHPSSLTWK